VTKFKVGDYAGVGCLVNSCGECEYCKKGEEQYCEKRILTYASKDSYHNNEITQGGYSNNIVVSEKFAIKILQNAQLEKVAPLLCAGIVGYRSLKLSDLQPGERLGLYGFGGSAHICVQVARYWGCEVYVFTRGAEHQRHALDLGAAWAGQAQDEPPRPLDRSIIFAPAGWIVPLALGHLRKSGTLCINAIHMSDLPSMPYSLLWHERTIRSVANATRRDAEEFMPLAAQIPIHTDTQPFDLDEANHALLLLKQGQIQGAAVLHP
jgi:propanol-preferring alcohol dehydrogenase